MQQTAFIDELFGRQLAPDINHMPDSSCTSMLPPHMPDPQLVARAKAGDNEAREQLIGQSWGRCMSLAIRLLRSSDEASDVMQSAFCQALTHLGAFRGQAEFSTWVTRMVITECIIQSRSTRSTKVVSYDQTPGAVEYLVEDSSCYGDPESKLAGQEIGDVLLFELSRVPRFLRIPLTLCYLEGLTLDSVAGRLGITVMGVKSRLHRGRNYLKKRMMRHCNQRSGVRLFVQN